MTMLQSASETRLGMTSAIGAYVWWGAVMPVFLIALRGVGADEVLVHRILWSVPFGALILAVRDQWTDVRRALADSRVLLALVGSSTFIALNWLVYIMAVQDGRIFQAALGYYINPLVYVLVGVVVLGERLSRGQKAAVALAAIGVTILTVYGGQFPTVAMILALSFTAYGYLRKMTPVGAMPGLFIETLILAPVAFGYLLLFEGMALSSFGTGVVPTLLLVAAGPVTVIPLLAFAIGARRLPLSTIGFLQFIGPTLQFLVGVIDGEPFSRATQICFGFIWAAAAIFAFDAIRRTRRPVVSETVMAGGEKRRGTLRGNEGSGTPPRP